jgi:acetyltransferase-like isoleucine patch superfamily enzyme
MTLPPLAECGALLQAQRAATEQLRLKPGRIPRRVVQFWDREPPEQIRKLVEHNRKLVRDAGAEYVFFDAEAARGFIESHFPTRFLNAFDIAVHPAMKCDVFRLCYIWKQGGYYLDADLALRSRIDELFGLHGNCVVFQWDSRDLTNCCNWLLGARAGDPLLESAMNETAASILAACRRNPDAALKNILNVSGPGIFTRAIVKGLQVLTADGRAELVQLNVQTVSMANRLTQLGPAFLGEPLYYKSGADTRHWATARQSAPSPLQGAAAEPTVSASHHSAPAGATPHLKVRDQGQNNSVSVPELREGNLVVILNGNHNEIIIGAKSRVPNLKIDIQGHHCRVEIGPDCTLSGEIVFRDSHGALVIGAKTTILNSRICLHEPGTIVIGADCLLDGDIRMNTSDMHSIVDAATGERLNPPGDIEIGDHVWLAFGAYVHKGVRIGRNCVVGARAVVADDIPPGSLAEGVPARVVRSGISWDWRRLPWKMPGKASGTTAQLQPAELDPGADTTNRKSGVAQAFSWLRGRKSEE